MLRKIIVFISVILIISTSIPAFAESSISSEKGKEIIVNIDGAKVNFTDAKPYLSDTGRTMVPIRAVSEAMQAKVDWNGIFIVTVTKEDMTLSFSVDANYDKYLHISHTKLNRSKTKKILMDSPPVVKNGRTFVPLRVINEAFGYQVDWDSENYTVEINTKNLTTVSFTDNPALFEGSYFTMSDGAGEEIKDYLKNELKEEQGGSYSVDAGSEYSKDYVRDSLKVVQNGSFSSEASSEIEQLGTVDYSKISTEEMVYGASYDYYSSMKSMNYPYMGDLDELSKVYQFASKNKIVKEVKFEHSKTVIISPRDHASTSVLEVGKLKFIYHGITNEDYLKKYNGLVKIDTWYETPVYIILSMSRTNGSIHTGQIVLGDTWTEVK